MTDDINTEIDQESKAEAEIATATKSAASASQDGKISGLGPSDAVLHITFNPTPKAQYKTDCIDESSGEKKNYPDILLDSRSCVKSHD